MASRGTDTTEREGEDFISETEWQVSCKEGRREISKPEITGSTEQGGGGDRETKAEAEDNKAGAGAGVGTEAGAGEGLERVSELVNSAR